MGRTLRGVISLAIVALALVPAPAYAVTRSIVAQESNPEANLPFLFAAYAVVFLGLAGYILVLSRRQRELEREIKALGSRWKSRIRRRRRGQPSPGGLPGLDQGT